MTWQTHRDHVVRPRRRRRRCCRCRRHTFRFRSITFEGMHWLHWNFAELYITVKYIGNHPPNFGWVMAPFRLRFCWCVDIGFRSITFAGMHWFHWKFAEGYTIVKYRSHTKLVNFGKLWSFFDLAFVVGVKYKVKILFPLNHFWIDFIQSLQNGVSL